MKESALKRWLLNFLKKIKKMLYKQKKLLYIIQAFDEVHSNESTLGGSYHRINIQKFKGDLRIAFFGISGYFT